MDSFGVPKKINRHVLKALYYMHDCGYDNPEISEICESVEFTMKNNVPVRDLPGVVRQSLQNMAQLGVIERNGSNFFVRSTDLSAVFQKNYDPKIFRMNDRQHDGNRLEPFYRKSRPQCDESVAGNDVERARKRFRLNTPISRKGHRVITPRVKLSNRKFYMNADMEQESLPSKDRYMAEEEPEKSTCSLSTTVRIPFGSEVSEPEMEEQETVEPPAQQSNDNKDHSERYRSNNNISEPDPAPMTPKTEPDSEEVVTAEQKIETKSEDDSSCSISNNSHSVERKSEEYP